MAVIPDRCRWAVQALAPQPTERILEFGCGPGAAAELVCAVLSTGTLHAIDRSSTAITRTTDRNAAHIAAGRLTVAQSALADLDAGSSMLPSDAVLSDAAFDGPFDAAFGVNVNVFWTTTAAPELAALRAALVPGGRLLIAYDERPTSAHLQTVRAHVTDAGFVDVIIVGDARGSGVRARNP